MTYRCGGEIHQSLLNLMKSSTYHYGEGVGLVAVCGRGTGYDMDRVGMRKDWGGTGEWYFQENGGGGYRLTWGSRSQSQTAGLGMGLFSNLCMSWCWKLSTSTHKNAIIFPTRNPLPIISNSNINPPFSHLEYPWSSLPSFFFSLS